MPLVACGSSRKAGLMWSWVLATVSSRQAASRDILFIIIIDCRFLLIITRIKFFLTKFRGNALSVVSFE